jgi:hypothetical protein
MNTNISADGSHADDGLPLSPWSITLTEKCGALAAIGEMMAVEGSRSIESQGDD